jgi:copper transport protein
VPVTQRLPAVLAGALVAVAWMAATPAPAGAHATLTASAPADGASLERPPTEAVLTFNEAPDPVLSAVQVLDASGRRVEASKVEAVPAQPAQLRVGLGTLAQGTYTVAWRVTSAVDGHTTVGSVAFGVGVPAVAAGTGGAPAEVRTPFPTGASVAGRWLFYVGVVLMLGASVVGVVVAGPLALSRWLMSSAWAAAASGLLLTIADYRLEARTTLTHLLSSPTGHKLAVQAFAVALAGVAVVWACLRPSRSSLVAVGVGASAAMLARALAGHANASSVRWFTIGVQWVHLVSVGVWVGGLVWLLVAMRRAGPGQGPGLVRRFSSVAAGTLGVVAVSGALRALDEVGGWAGLVDTTFGVTLLVKFGLFAALVALGAVSRFRHVPAASANRVGALCRVVRAEVAIAVAVLGATALLAGLPPSASLATASKPRPAPGVTVTGHDYATSVRVRLVVTPGSTGPNSFDATVADYDSGEPVPADTVSLRFQPQDRPEVGATMLELARDPDSHWRGSGSVLSINGRWRVTALVQTPTDAVEVPMDLVTADTAGVDAATSAGGGSCGTGTPDPSYRVTMDSDPDPPKAERTTFHLTVRQDGRAVTGAKICVRADMPDMQHPGVNTVAREASAGNYDAELKFSMTGAWEASVTIAEPGKTPGSVEMRFDVE